MFVMGSESVIYSIINAYYCRVIIFIIVLIVILYRDPLRSPRFEWSCTFDVSGERRNVVVKVLHRDADGNDVVGPEGKSTVGEDYGSRGYGGFREQWKRCSEKIHAREFMQHSESIWARCLRRAVYGSIVFSS